MNECNEYNEVSYPYVLTVYAKEKPPVTIKFSVKGEAREYIRQEIVFGQKSPSMFEDDFGYKPTRWTITEETT